MASILEAIIPVSRDFTLWQIAGICGQRQNSQVQFFVLKAFSFVRTRLLLRSSSADHIPIGCVLKIKSDICSFFFEMLNHVLPPVGDGAFALGNLGM